MGRPTFTILTKDDRSTQAIFSVLADNAAGFDEFTLRYANKILPGSTVDIADYKMVFRLRNDGTWEQYSSYAASSEEQDALEEAATAALLTDLIPDEETESEEAETV